MATGWQFVKIVQSWLVRVKQYQTLLARARAEAWGWNPERRRAVGERLKRSRKLLLEASSVLDREAAAAGVDVSTRIKHVAEEGREEGQAPLAQMGLILQEQVLDALKGLKAVYEEGLYAV